jgi:tryptophanyl-tRNA synthetase
MSRINLTDAADQIAQKIRKAKTDPEPLPESLEELAARREAANLVGIYAALADESAETVLARFAGQPFSVFKPALAELAVETLGPIGAEMRRLTADPGHIDAVLRDGAARASALAAPILAEVYDTVGLLRG